MIQVSHAWQTRIMNRLLDMLLIDSRNREVFTAAFSTSILFFILFYGDTGRNFVIYVKLIAPYIALPYVFAALATLQWSSTMSNSRFFRQVVATIDCGFWLFIFVGVFRDANVGMTHATSLMMALSAAFTCLQLKLRETGNCA